jgi:hypothetical protein
VWKPVDRVARRVLFGDRDSRQDDTPATDAAIANETKARCRVIVEFLKKHRSGNFSEFASACAHAGLKTGKIRAALVTLMHERQIVQVRNRYKLAPAAHPHPEGLSSDSKNRLIPSAKPSNSGTGTASVQRAKYGAMGPKGRKLTIAMEAELPGNRPVKTPSTGTGARLSVLRAKYRAMGLKGRELTAAVEAEAERI